MSHEFQYIGEELDVFALAVNWKRYWGAKIQPFIGKTILEVGAGIGGTTRVLYRPTYTRWVALEPDAAMVNDLKAQQAAGAFDSGIEFVTGTVTDLDDSQHFDTILYIDVLEHIEDDRGEVERAAYYLNPGGYLVVLSPAYQFLYTEFDEAIGHYRRYRRRDMRHLTPPTLRAHKAFYLDAIGVMASTVNLLFLHSPNPTAQQIKFWDNVMIPLSKYLFDPLTFYRFGRSVIFVWQRIN